MLNAIKHKIWPYMFTLGLFICNTAFANAAVPASNQQKLKEELQQLYLQDGAIIIGSVVFAFLLVHLCKKIRSQKLAVFLKASIVVIAVLFNSVWLFLSCNTYIDAHLRLGTKEQIAHVVGDIFSPNFPSVIGGNVINFAVFNNYNTELVEQLINLGASTEKRFWWGDTPLSFATSEDLPDIILLLVRHGADVNHQSGKHKLDLTPLMNIVTLSNMVHSDKKAVMKAMIKAGANLEAKDGLGRTVLHLAVLFYIVDRNNISLEIIQILLDSGANMHNEQTEHIGGKTIVHTPYSMATNQNAINKKPELAKLFEQYKTKKDSTTENKTD